MNELFNLIEDHRTDLIERYNRSEKLKEKKILASNILTLDVLSYDASAILSNTLSGKEEILADISAMQGEINLGLEGVITFDDTDALLNKINILLWKVREYISK